MSAVAPLSAQDFLPMNVSHLPQVSAIERASYAFPWPEDIFMNCLNVGYSCWVIQDSAHILAYGIMSVVAQEAHILNICVHKNYRRRGLGENMLLFLLNLAAERKTEIVFLEARISNKTAIQLYLKHGFYQAGHKRNYYPAKTGYEDAFIFAKSLQTENIFKCP